MSERNRRKSAPNKVRPRRRLGAESLERRDVLSTLAWTSGVGLPAAESGISAAMSGSTILLFGNGSNTVESLAGGANTWTNAGAIDSARFTPGVADSGGQLLVYGGDSPSAGGTTDSAVVFSNKVATQVNSLNTPREDFAFASAGPYAYAIGGRDDNGVLLRSAERYDPTQADWFSIASLPVALFGAQAVYDNAESIYVFGGRTSAGISNAVYRYNITGDSWTKVGTMPVAEASAAAVLGSDGTIDVLGGVGASGNSMATVQRLNPATNTWWIGRSLPASVSNEAAVVDSLGRIEVIGGQNQQGSVVTKSAAVYVTDTAPTFTSSAPANPTVVIGGTFTYKAAATGTPAPNFSLVAPPGGASIDPRTGACSFAPSLSQTGVVTFDIRASNVYATADQVFAVTVKAPAPTGFAVTGASLTTISLGWNANAGAVDYRVYMDGQLPQFDIAADHITGTSVTITGLASQIAGHTFYITSFDQAGNESLFSAPIVGHTWTTGALQYTSNYGNYLSFPATHTLEIHLSNPGANPPPTSYSIVSGAPTGMSIDSSTGVITWTPSDAQALHGYFPIVSSTNAAGTATLELGIAVQFNYPAISATYPGTTGATAYSNLPFELQFHDSSGAAVTWKLDDAPAGAKLSSTGLINWTPTVAQALAAQNATFTVTATNYAGSSTFSVTVPLFTLAAPSKLAYSLDAAHGTLAANWVAPAVSALPIADYEVTLSYYYITSGSGRGGHGTVHRGSWELTVSGNTLQALFSSIPFRTLPSAHFTLRVVAVDTAGTASPAISVNVY